MSKNSLIPFVCLLVLTACGYGREDDKLEERRSEVLELREEMSSTLTGLNALKMQLKDSLAGFSAREDSLAMVKSDKYQLLVVELEEAEESYESWKEQLILEPEEMEYEEAMIYFDEQEQVGEGVQQDLHQALEYVQSELNEEEEL